jgi:hypothetical protein
MTDGALGIEPQPACAQRSISPTDIAEGWQSEVGARLRVGSNVYAAYGSAVSRNSRTERTS